MASKAKNMRQRCASLGGGRRGSGVKEMACPRMEIQELSSLKHHSLILRPVLRKSAVVIFRQQFKAFNSNNFTVPSMFSFQNTWLIKRKAVDTLVLFHIFILFLDLVRIRSDHNLRIFKKIYLISVNLQAVSDGKKSR